ncbi:MAG: peptidoglycan bridge formation glycyltransferase FemA/FemB family protein, partial [Patescibacteria group bacterium]
QVGQFAPTGEVSLYLAHYNGEVIAASIHMHFGGETSYHHGASTQKYKNIPASYLLQWRAITEALARGDHVYNFWGIAPEGVMRHPFAGVRTFKTAFGGRLLELAHCMDIPLSKKYWVTLGIETVRKWRRGF